MRDIIQILGDSISAGYNDAWADASPLSISTRGIGGYLAGECWKSDMAEPVPMAVNCGQPGAQVAEYLARGRGWVDGNPQMFTACVFSAWSPNVPDGETAPYACSDAVLAANRIELQNHHDWCLSKNIIPILTFIYASPFLLSSADFVRLKNEMDWLRTHYSHDGTVAGSYMLFCGGTAAAAGGMANDTYYPAEYRGYPLGDATHPPWNGYRIHDAYFMANYATVRANSILANGFGV